MFSSDANTAPKLAILLVSLFLAGCGDLLPRADAVTEGPWQSFQDAQKTFDKILPRQTTIVDLKHLHLDPESNPNITILNYSDVLRRFIPSPSVNSPELDDGVQECINAKSACKGYEVEQRVVRRNRYGSFLADFLNFRRKVDVAGWRFNGVILIKGDTVVYKLTGGQPVIHELEENNNPLGPLQGIGESKVLGR